MLNNIRTMFQVDPTRTLTLRNKFESQMYNRFRKLKGDIRKSIIDNDVFGYRSITTNEPLNPRQFAFVRDPAKISLFLQWLQKQVDSGILELYYGNQLGTAIEEAWTNTYIRASYEKGVTRGQQELLAAGYTLPATISLGASMSMPFHIDRVGLLYTRTFTGLKGITDEMSKQIAEILAEGMAMGQGPVEIARKINNRVDKIGLTRAKTLARTEMIRAHHQAMVQEFKNWGVVGVRVMAEWVTAGDGRVCPICRPLHRKIFTLKRVENMIPRHPGCVTGDSVIVSPDMEATMKTVYSGPIVKLTLANGTTVSVTPNHMFPTTNGFVMSGFLSNTDSLLYSTDIKRKVFGDPNYDRNISRIDNIVKSFSESCSSSSSTVPLSPEQLHGDAIFCKKDINIVDTTRFLKNGVNAEFIKHFSSKDLSSSSVLDAFTSFSSFASFFKRSFSTSSRDIGISREFFAFFNGCLLHSKNHGFTTISGWDSVYLKTSDYNRATNSKIFSKFINRNTVIEFSDNFVNIDIMSVVELIRSEIESGFDESIFDCVRFNTDVFSNLVNRFPTHISPVQIIKVSSYHVTDLPVYDLSTMATLYNVNGILSSNCRCMIIPLDVTDNKELEDKIRNQEN